MRRETQRLRSQVFRKKICSQSYVLNGCTRNKEQGPDRICLVIIKQTSSANASKNGISITLSPKERDMGDKRKGDQI